MSSSVGLLKTALNESPAALSCIGETIEIKHFTALRFHAKLFHASHEQAQNTIRRSEKRAKRVAGGDRHRYPFHPELTWPVVRPGPKRTFRKFVEVSL